MYEYVCKQCGTAFESLILRPSDEAENACPECKSQEVERQISRPAPARWSGGSGGWGRASAGGRCGPVG